MRRALAAIFFLAGLSVLISLGIWQYQRLQWKSAIIDTLEQQYTFLPQKSSVISKSRIDQALKAGDKPFIVDKASGTLLRDKTLFVGPKPLNSRIGYDVVAPLEMGDGTLLVNLGWIAQDKKDTLALPRHIVVNGVARKPDYSSFASKNSPALDLWFQEDTALIAAHKNLPNVAPLVFYAQDSVTPDITPHAAHWLPRNKHKQYMIFWFGMAGAWIAVFTLAARRQRQG